MSSPALNTGRFIHKDPDVNLFMSQEKQKIEWLKQLAAERLNAELSTLLPTDLADDSKIKSVWNQFKTNGINQLYSKLFISCNEDEKYKEALHGSLLNVFQECIKRARAK